MPQTGDNSFEHSGRILRSPWFATSVIVLAVSAAYSNSLWGPFIFDDKSAIEDNPTIRSLWPIHKVLNPPGEGKTVQGRPVVNLSLAINYALGGEAVLGYHLLNLAVHTLAALVLFGIVRRTLLLPGQAQRLAEQSTGLALAVALLWGVHPLTTAAVTYIIQRAESLMSLFYLLTLYCVIRSAAAGRRGLCWWKTAAVLACLLGMGCKEVMVSAPLMVLLYDRVFLSRSLNECFRQRGLVYAGLAASWVLLGWLVIAAGTRGGSAGFVGKVAWWEYGLTQCQAVVMYLKLCFWPHPLVFDYGAAVITNPLQVWPQALLLALLAGGVLAALRWRPEISFLATCFFAVLAPSSGVVPVATQTMAEHRMYLPLAIVVALSVLLVSQGWERIWVGWEQGRQRWRWAPAIALVLTAILLGGLTLRRNQDYRSAMAIWTDTINKRPENPRAYSGRGDVYFDGGKFQEAVPDYTRAIALKPDYYQACNNRGNAYLNLGRLQEALEDLTQAIALKPSSFGTYSNRANVYQRLGQFQQALADYTQAIALKADAAVTYYNRADSYESLGRFQEALADYAQAITLKPDYAEAYFNRGVLHRSLGRFQEALADFNQAITLKPGDFQAYSNRGIIYLSLGLTGPALEDFTRAVTLKPDFAEAYYNRGMMYAGSGQFDRALADYTQTIALKPGFPEAYANRARVLYELKQYDRAWADVAQAKQLGHVPEAEFLRALAEASGRSQ